MYKLSSQPYLFLMETCQFNEYFDPVSFRCYECRPAHHSFGLQDESCYPCNALWMQSKGDDVKWAIFNQKCTDGEAKAIIVVSVTVVFIVVVGTVCCCFNRSLEKLLR